MQGNQLERLRQEQLREGMEQLSTIKREMKNFPHIEVIEKIGQGSFGDIYKVWDSKRARWAAMKFEKRDKKNKYSLLQKEAQIMEEFRGSRYFAVLYEKMTFLGPNLESLKKRMGGKFSLRTVLLIANQMISGLEAMHKKGIIHRDIKPENFVIGSEGEHHQVFVIDFGLSKYYIENDGRHIEQKQNKGLVGTARYTSVNSHLGLEQSRRDDLESLGYLLLYFIRSSLLWQNLQVKDKEERFQKIAQIKQTTSSEVLCKGLPKAFFEFLSAVKALQFQQTPEYARYRQLFSACYQQNFITPEANSCFDWCPKNCPLFVKPKGPPIQMNNIVVDLESQLAAAAPVYPKTTRDINKQNNIDESMNNAVDKQVLQQQYNTPQASKKENTQNLKINLETQNIINNTNIDSKQMSKLAFSTLAGQQIVLKHDPRLVPSPLAASTGNILVNGKNIVADNNYLAASKMLNQNLITSASSVANNLNASARQDIDGDQQVQMSDNNLKNMKEKNNQNNLKYRYDSVQNENSRALLAMLDRHAAHPVIQDVNNNLHNNLHNNNNNNNNIHNNNNNNQESLSEDSLVSERLPGERNKRVPVFVAQDNHHKNTGIVESKRLIVQPVQKMERDERKSTPIQGKISHFDKLNENDVKIKSSYLTLQPQLQEQELNQGNSQYSNQSNEWNSEQDEKVDIKQMLKFSSSHSNQHYP